MIPQDATRKRIAFNSSPFRNNDSLRVLLVHKKSRLEIYASEHTDLLTDDLKEEHFQHSRCLEKVKACLLAKGTNVELRYRGDLNPDITHGRVIITVGGDGTILDASHFSYDSPILGVNSDPERSVGSLCVANSDNFETLFDQLENETLPLLPVARIGGTLDNKDLPVLALNEILVAHQNPAAMSRYIIQVNGKTEEHKSSGIWIAAPAGSTGATLSAGGIVQGLHDSRIQLVVREPYFSEGKVTQMLAGLVRQDEVLRLTSSMPGGQIFFDGPHCFEKFSMGSNLEIHSRGSPLFLFVTDEMEYRRSQMARLRESFHDKMVQIHQEFVV